ERYANLTLPWWPCEKQHEIADFLDAETARIDTLIANKQRMIAVLDERRRAHVDHVTQVGTECRVRRVTSLITSGPRGWAERVGDVGLPFIRSASLRRDGLDLRTDNLARVPPDDAAEAGRSQTRTGDT